MKPIDLIIVLSVILTAFSLIFWTIKLGIGPVPTSRKVSDTLYQHLPGQVNGKIAELGCGWGNLIRVLKKKYPENTIIGYERSPIPRWVSRCLYSVPVYGIDFFQADLSEASLVVCYLYPKAMERMAKELLPQLPAGCLIITHTFALPGLEPEQIFRAPDIYQTPVYIYRIARMTQSIN